MKKLLIILAILIMIGGMMFLVLDKENETMLKEDSVEDLSPSTEEMELNKATEEQEVEQETSSKKLPNSVEKDITNQETENGYTRLTSSDSKTVARAFNDLSFQILGTDRGDFNYLTDMGQLVDTLAKVAESDDKDSAFLAINILTKVMLAGVGQNLLKIDQMSEERKNQFVEHLEYFEKANIKERFLTLAKSGTDKVNQFATVGLVHLDPLSEQNDGLIIDLINLDRSDEASGHVLYALNQAVGLPDFDQHQPRPISSKMANMLYGLLEHRDRLIRSNATKILINSRSDDVAQVILDRLSTDISDEIFDKSLIILKRKSRDQLSQVNNIKDVANNINDVNRRDKYNEFLSWIDS